MPSVAAHLRILRESLTTHVPYTAGVHPVKAEDLAIYYATDEESNARVINLGNATEACLAELAAACEPASFGVNQKDVLDESYRKAGKMDLTRFAARLDVVASGIIDAISPDILDEEDAEGEKVLRAEMYKLNVYGPGSFFKAHKDTPRGESMIGSLVVVLPTAHKGGELTLSHGATTWTFDSAAELGTAAGPSVAYVAFYSDVTHAVKPVQEGHRVTLTYNLFLADRTGAAGRRLTPPPENAFERALSALLTDESFFPYGGLLAYGLEHQYPIPTSAKRTSLGPVLQMLKGSDARIRTISARAGLATHVKILYNNGGRYDNELLVDHVLNLENVDEQYGRSVHEELQSEGVILQHAEERDSEDGGMYYGVEEYNQESVPVHWVMQITTLNCVGSGYLAYGNESSIGHVYGNAALFVSVPAVGAGVRGA
ncbi:hypothetical protein B0H17DRAFT_946090 [Mycena rosella]|uniref:Prolyl 4-hydroxylase alpha subunit Fe(2+) 2OG dioxygenase domain-containing protein n=1 Tax=Mycena rosella TaxID=1033263 RepID=A0AAD7GA86_MYCRO|nr:hypothetical protein B0H17DRAFT_946090 [Mycena rosella]